MELGSQRYHLAETRAVVALIQNQIPAQWRSVIYWHVLLIMLCRLFWRKSWSAGTWRDLVFDVVWPPLPTLRLKDGRSLITLPDGQTVCHHAAPEPWLMYVHPGWKQDYIEAMRPKAEVS